MNSKRLIPLFVIIPLLVSCKPKELVIPTVDVEKLHITLPTRPTYNVGEIKNDETYDYIDFYEISDFHGAVNEEPSNIGLSKLASYFDIKRSSNEGGTVILSSGDMFQGSAESNLTRGYMVNYSMNYMGFDSMTLGNHEYDWTTDWIKKNANLVYDGYKIPYLCANLIEKSTGKIPDFAKKSVIINRGNYKIGIIGSMPSELKKSILTSCIADYDFKDEKSAVEQEAAALRQQNCDIVVWSTHNSLDSIQYVSGVDAIFGGHAHQNKVKGIGGIPAVATANYGRGIGHIELKINKSTKEVTEGYSGVDESPKSLFGLKVNEDIKTIMAQYNSSLDEIKNIELGSCRETLESSIQLKNICVDAMHKAASKANTELHLDIQDDHLIAAYHNVSGGVRSNIDKGKITYGNVYKAFPFDNEIVLWKVSGKLYKSKCANTVFATWAIWRNFKNRIDLSDTEDYYLILTDFMALSENYMKQPTVFPEIEEANLIRTGKIVRDEVAKYIYELNKVNADEFTNTKDCFRPVTLF